MVDFSSFSLSNLGDFLDESDSDIEDEEMFALKIDSPATSIDFHGLAQINYSYLYRSCGFALLFQRHSSISYSI